MQKIGRVLAEYRKKKGLSQSELVERLNEQGIHVTAKAVSKWETDTREPGLSVFFTLCQILGIEDIYEACLGFNPYSIMNGLNQEGRDKLKEYAYLLNASGLFRSDSQKILPFRPVDIYESRVSAGTGNFLTDGLRETYDVGSLAPEHTDFGVRISGDSMQPLYDDGEIAWVSKKDRLSSGEIGVFYHNGDAYIKEFYEGNDGIFLVSLNKKYTPIPVHETDTFKVFGKVIGKCKESELKGLNEY